MRVLARALFVPVVVLSMLSSCAKNAILREDATTLSADIASVQAQTREFYAKHSAARLDFLLRIIASDPKCRYQFPIYVVTITSPAHKVRCAEDPEKRIISNGGTLPNASYTLFALPQDQDYAALQLVSVVAEYQTVLAKAVEDPKFDATAELTALSERVANLQDRYRELAGKPAESTLSAYSEEIKAIGALANLVTQAMADHKSVARLRELVSSRGVDFETALAALAHRYRSHDAKLLNNLEQFSLLARAREFDNQLAKIPEEGERYKRLKAFAAEQDVSARQLTKTDPLATALEGLTRTHEDFRLALMEDRLTDSQRQRIARKTFQDLKAWFNAVRQVAVLL